MQKMEVVTIEATTTRYIGECPPAVDVLELAVHGPNSSDCMNRGITKNGRSLDEWKESQIGLISPEEEIKDLPQTDGLVGNHVNAPQTESSNVSHDKQIGITLFQNQPNPFMFETKIGFFVPERDEVRFSIRDLHGRVVHQHKDTYDRGYHELTVYRANLPYGILYYSVDYRGDHKIARMFVAE